MWKQCTDNDSSVFIAAIFAVFVILRTLLKQHGDYTDADMFVFVSESHVSITCHLALAVNL